MNVFEIDKYTTLKFIFEKTHFRYNDEALAFLNQFKKDRSYAELDIINNLCRLVIDSTLENVAALDCVKIIIEK